MGDGEPVHPEPLVEPGTSRHQDELDQREVGAVERAELADRGEHAARRRELVGPAMAVPHETDHDRL